MDVKTHVIERANDHLKVMCMGKLYILRFNYCKRSKEEILNDCNDVQKEKAIAFGQMSLFN